MSLAQWLEDRRWAANARRARAFRRKLVYSDRRRFDSALRPTIDKNSVIGYPDAFYAFEIDDLIRAMNVGEGLYEEQYGRHGTRDLR